MTTTQNYLFFFAEFIFDLYIFFLWLRVVCEFFQVDPNNPIRKFIFRNTWITYPFRKLIPTHKKIEWGVILLIFIFEFAKIFILTWLAFKTFPNYLAAIVLGIGQVISQLINVFFFSLLLRAFLSWIGMTTNNAFFKLLYTITEPLLSRFRHLIPKTGTFDLLAFSVGFFLKFLDLLIILKLTTWGQAHILNLL